MEQVTAMITMPVTPAGAKMYQRFQESPAPEKTEIVIVTERRVTPDKFDRIMAAVVNILNEREIVGS